MRMDMAESRNQKGGNSPPEVIDLTEDEELQEAKLLSLGIMNKG